MQRSFSAGRSRHAQEDRNIGACIIRDVCVQHHMNARAPKSVCCPPEARMPSVAAMVPRGLGATRKSWLSTLDDTEFAYVGGSALALLVVLIAGCILLFRRLSGNRRRQDQIEPAFAEEYDVLQVIVHAHEQEAELEVQTDAWNSYEEVRPNPHEIFVAAFYPLTLNTPTFHANAAAGTRGGCGANNVSRHR